jgi:alpha-beta hydrolase superfamily lysophospholipase
MKPTLKRILHWLLAAALGSAITAMAIGVWALNNRDDLGPWHTQDLNETFYSPDEVGTPEMVLRYSAGSLSDPVRWERNWNRSFLLGQPGSKKAVLLLHGMSDSPYSLRSVGEALAADGAHVLGLRLPGHGTVPSGLVGLRVEDMRAAVRLAMAHLAQQNPGATLKVVGYSNGAALALDYTLSALRDPQLKKPDRLVLLSPMIGISSLAQYAVWQARLGTLLGLDKLAWNGIELEYDPYKYNSFAVNAGDVTYRLTNELQTALAQAESEGLLDEMPPVLTFLSAVDATVSAPAVASQLYRRLTAERHELVLFDVNRQAEESDMLSWNPSVLLDALGDDLQRGYTLSVVTNIAQHSSAVEWRQWAPGAKAPQSVAMDSAWPAGIYSLSHVALPFPQADPLYGNLPIGPEEAHIRLGALAARGERGVLRIPSDVMLRQRWNPFHDWMIERIINAP